MLVMYVSKKISASVIAFGYVHFQMAGSPLVQQYQMEETEIRQESLVTEV